MTARLEMGHPDLTLDHTGGVLHAIRLGFPGFLHVISRSRLAASGSGVQKTLRGAVAAAQKHRTGGGLLRPLKSMDFYREDQVFTFPI